MVNNLFEVLNGFNINDKLNIIEYNMKPNYIYQFENILHDYKYKLNNLEMQKDAMIIKNDWRRGQYFRAPWTQNDYDKICEKYNNLKSDEFLNEWSVYDKIPKFLWKNKKICEYLDVIPFTPSIMINISPDWNSIPDRMTQNRQIKILEGIIEKYMEESQRYDKYSYVIENGFDGKNIHAHIVAHVNPRIQKSVYTHIDKNKHVYQIQKYAKKLNFKGADKLIKNNSIQRTWIRTEEILNDKLDYLIEEKKPEGHKNHSVIGDGRVDRVLFTVK